MKNTLTGQFQQIKRYWLEKLRSIDVGMPQLYIFITWKINETMIEDVSDLPPGITRDVLIEGGGLVYTLRILGRPEYNTTTVVCVALISNGLNETTSPAAILQGMYTTRSFQP